MFVLGAACEHVLQTFLLLRRGIQSCRQKGTRATGVYTILLWGRFF